MPEISQFCTHKIDFCLYQQGDSRRAIWQNIWHKLEWCVILIKTGENGQVEDKRKSGRPKKTTTIYYMSI